MYTQVPVTAISLRAKEWDKVGNADKIEAFAREACRDDPKLVVFPEGALEGYVTCDVIANPEKVDAMFEIAEPIDGPFVERFRGLARALGICLCFGFAERVADGIYNCAVFVDQDGEIHGATAGGNGPELPAMDG